MKPGARAFQHAGWKATGFRFCRGRRCEDHIGIFKSWIDADQAADAYYAATRRAFNVVIERHYEEVPDDD